ncbi:von Willebrand factor A [Intrasporangium chromatireducens Q5-1]|uniref:von Willebrand factor A n=1 Tax=Intrasporangium chromatireducens Q5-1 TaxID=584657 RepID=W9GTS0_9MICO|nr:VWA domain-containing protein [Intrasporangium chromatireducens]EWT07284.1 von Willebrand factor A [Intrasporangium chromatireducens Q5-1]
MELRTPEVLAWGLFAAALLAAAVLWRELRGRGATRRPVANSATLTRLPAFRAALRAHRARTAALAGAAALLAGASLLGAARPVDTTVERPQSRSRDIMLCLDVSGSMASYDAELVRTFRRLVADFEGERIGMVIFNGSAATVFPLTDDYDYINEELDGAEQALTGGSVQDAFFAGTFNGWGTSLIGDGLATCVTSFDRADTQRARSVVFATDNEVAGRPLVPLTDAGQLARAKAVRVYGLSPAPDGASRESVEMRDVVEGTGGRFYSMTDRGAIGGIVESVQAQEATVIESASRALRTDSPALPIAAASLAFVGLVVASRRWRS